MNGEGGDSTWSAVAANGRVDGEDGVNHHDGPVRSASVSSMSPSHGPSKYISPHIGNINKGDAIDLISRKNSTSMDEQRKEHIAYEYLCHLEEAKQWIEGCIDEELPVTTELEEAMRPGVILCKLGNWYAPEVLPLRKIYDIDGMRLQLKGLHFKHTDNFNYWLKSLRHIGLPEIFYPETTDLYDKKNMPRVVYCVHALSIYLHKLGKAPEIENLVGTVVFTPEEISAMKSELDKYGITMPSFGKIGGILATEMSVDEAAIHAAVLAINEAIDGGDHLITLSKLQNPAAVLNDIESDNSPRYQSSLETSKKGKKESAADGGDVSEADAYDFMLTQNEIQSCVDSVNGQVKEEARQAKLSECVSLINSAVTKGSMTALLNSLQQEGAELKDVIPQNLRWYNDILSRTRAGNGELGNEDLTHEEIQDIILMANQIAEHTRLVEAAVLTINKSLVSDASSTGDVLETLQSEHLSHFSIVPANAQYYAEGLRERLRQKREKTGNPSCLLTEDEIEDEIHSCNERAEKDRLVALAYQKINESISADSPQETMSSLLDTHTDLSHLVLESSADRYHAQLKEAQEAKGGELLTKDEVIKAIEEVNRQVEAEKLMSEGVTSINSALSSSESSTLLGTLTNEHVGLEEVDCGNCPHYATLMTAALTAKIERTGDSNATLTQEEIQALIRKGNEQTKEAIRMAKAVHDINETVRSSESASTLTALKSSELSLRSITDECSETYHEKLLQARDSKTSVEGDATGWTEHKTRDGYTCYYDNQTGEYSWEYPEGWTGVSSDLSREEIQNIITKVTADYDRWALLKANEPLVVTLQSQWRGLLVRRAYNKRLDYLKDHEKEAVKLQAHWKGFKQRTAYKERKELLTNSVHIIIKLQSWARMCRQRRMYRERLEFFRSNVEAVVRIQTFWRAKKTKKDYKQLVQVTKPPASAVRKFLSLLEQSDLDFSEEIECQRLKSQVVQQIRSNQQLEQDLRVIDLKIGLLVKNRLTIQDVVSHTDQIKRNRKRGKSRVGVTSEDEDEEAVGGLRGLSKSSQEKIEAYQNLFYLLQTEPRYFAKLIFEMSPNRTNKFMENVILTVLNYAQNNREQYLLVKLFETALFEEIESKVFALKDIITGNPTVIKMVIHFTRSESEGGHTVLRELLAPLVQEILAKDDLVLNTSPVDVYKSWINQMESETGEKSKLPYEVSNDQALDHEEVKKRIATTIQVLIDATERFQTTILASVNRIPYTMRYIAMCLREALHKKFPESSEDDVLKVVGNLLYYRYMNPAIVAPDAFDIIDMGVEKRVLESDQRRNLGAIAKVLQHAAAGKLFEGENAALSSMNGYIQQAFQRFKQFFLAASTVEPPNQRFGYDEYTDVIMVTKPVIYITVKEALRTHTLLVEHEEALAPESSDPLRTILKDLGTIPTVEALLGGVRDAAPGEDKEDIINEASKQELALTLTNKFEATSDDSSDMKALFVRTKRMVVDLLRVQPGDNLTDILYTPATPEQEEEHQRMIKEREESEKLNKSLPVSQLQSDSVYTDRDLPLEGMKRKIMRQLRSLEQEEMVSSKDDYQEIINSIAKDIRNQHRHRQQRKVELKRLQETMEKLNLKAQFCEEQMEYYQQYVKACLESLAKASSGPAGGGSKKQTVKYTAQRLHEKGVVLEIDGLPKHQFRNAVIEITSMDAGVFEVKGRVLGVALDKFELVFQDLLQMQYEGVAVMKILGRAKINVNLLIYLINKKFYGKG